MSLLELERVSKRFGRGAAQRTVLNELTLQIEAGELVAIWGGRRSGRSTLLRIASGIAPPDEGVVLLEGRNLAGRDADARRQAVGYCVTTHRPREAQLVLEQLVTDQLVRGIGIELAEQQARIALTRAGAERSATAQLKELDAAEAVRVAVARALSRQPKLLVIDEPTLGIDLEARDEILRLLRSLADEGIAVLMTAGETPSLSGADRALSLGQGQLHGDLVPKPSSTPTASVLPFRRSA